MEEMQLTPEGGNHLPVIHSTCLAWCSRWRGESLSSIYLFASPSPASAGKYLG